MCVAGGSHRFAEGLKDLPPEHMEVVGWGGAVRYDPVTVIQLLDLKVSCDFLKEKQKASAKIKIDCILPDI